MISMSRPAWACELKYENKTIDTATLLSRPAWACELKLGSKRYVGIENSRALRGRVS